jgi:calcineurin-like phosphoesterase family protein
MKIEKYFVNQLNGKIHFIYGNHDDDRITKLNRFETISDYVTLSILDRIHLENIKI